MKIICFTLILVFFSITSFSQSINPDNHSSKKYYSNSCNYPETPNYVPLEIRNYKDLPKNISRKTKKYLKKRVGRKLVKKFHLIDGRFIDLVELKKMNKSWNKSETSYDLCFAYKNKKAGINMYSFSIKLDKNGKVLQDIKFPKNSKKQKFKKLISFEEIKIIAKKKEGSYIEKTIVKKGNYVKYKTEIKMSYNENKNILVWTFFNKTQNNNNTMLYEKYIFNAHSGEFIELEINKGTWVN